MFQCTVDETPPILTDEDMREDERPTLTNCPRRWPDAYPTDLNMWECVRIATLLDTCTLVDDDLRTIVILVYDAYNANGDATSEWALANTIDVAVDEQDRRRGWARRASRPPNGPPPPPVEWEMMISSVKWSYAP